MAGIAQGTDRSYSPVYRARRLGDDDEDEVYEERIAQIALEMDQALDYMGEVGKFIEDREDIDILGDCEEMAQNVIEKHIDLIDQLNNEFIEENLQADHQLEILMEMQKAIGYEVTEVPAGNE